jgi:hypothetical protein
MSEKTSLLLRKESFVSKEKQGLAPRLSFLLNLLRYRAQTGFDPENQARLKRVNQ